MHGFVESKGTGASLDIQVLMTSRATIDGGTRHAGRGRLQVDRIVARRLTQTQRRQRASHHTVSQMTDAPQKNLARDPVDRRRIAASSTWAVI